MKEMNRPRVLVLMAAFNGSRWIQEQVETILAQINVDVYLLIRDDGSTDGTRSIIEQLVNDKRVQLFPSKTPSGSAAQNFLWLIRESTADAYDFVSFADQDDVWERDKLYRACSALTNSGAVGYSSAVTAFWQDGREKVLSQVAAITSSDFLFEGGGQGCTYVLTRDFYTKVRRTLLSLEHRTKSLHYHDWAIYALSRTWNSVWFFDRYSGLKYRQHENNDTGARNTMRGMRLRLGLIKRGWYRQQLQSIAEFCSEVDPNDPLILHWRTLLKRPPSFARIWGITAFCLRGGRRRPSDKIALVGCAVAGWI
jgi:rhamnosyltransferase